jgi:NTE family protein
MNHQLGLVLSGGGMRGAAAVGAVKALQETGIEPQFIAGTSVGAIVGAFYAAGYDASEMMDFLKNTPLFSLSGYTLTKSGILDAEKYAASLDPFFKNDHFEDLARPLYVAATNLNTGDCDYLHSGALVPALLASAALPGLFAPVRIGEHLYVDGGIIDNFPVEQLRDRCRYVLGISLNPLEEASDEALDSTFSVLKRVYHISLRYATAQRVNQCDWLVQPAELLRHNIFQKNTLEEMFDIGYQQTKDLCGEIRKTLEMGSLA